MEAALRSVLKESLGEFVKAHSLTKNDLSSFPLVLRNLELNEKKIQEEWDEDHESPLQLSSGKIGTIKITPGWMGTMDVHVTDVDLSFSFSPTQALKNQMKPKTQGATNDHQHRGAAPQAPPAPPPNCPPRFCCAHDSSNKRVKGDPVSRDCKSCGITLTSSYDGFKLCPPCSEKEEKCMICGSNAPKTGSYMPGEPQKQTAGHGEQGNLPPPPPPPRQPRDAGAQQQARGVSRNRERIPAAPSQYENAGQVFNTQLPPPESNKPPRSQPPPGAPGWDRNRGSMTERSRPQGPPFQQKPPQDSIAGFLQFIATDIFQACSRDNRQLNSPERPFVRRGGA